MFLNLCFLITCLRLTYCEILAPPTDIDWWKNAVIYEIFPLSFKDSNGDGSGDFKGILYKYTHLKLVFILNDLI